MQTPTFREGQRVKVEGLQDNGEPVDHFPVHYLKYHGKIGYIANLKNRSAANGKQGENQSRRYEVFITKLGILIELPENCLELAEYRRSVL
jgi:hypothetical protein